MAWATTRTITGLMVTARYNITVAVAILALLTILVRWTTTPCTIVAVIRAALLFYSDVLGLLSYSFTLLMTTIAVSCVAVSRVVAADITIVAGIAIAVSDVVVIIATTRATANSIAI